jgi:hypothetical protein
MRRLGSVVAAVTAAAALAACGPKVQVDEASPFERDDPRAGEPPPEPPRWEELPPAPPGPGQRGGTIERGALIAVLDAGPGQFLRGFEIAAELENGKTFRGWRLVQLMPGEGRFAGLDLAPGDVLVAINGQPLSRPDQLHALWESLRTADELTCDLERAGGRFQLRFAIEPALDADAAFPAPPPQAPTPAPTPKLTP